MRLIAYVRVSSDSQLDGFGLDVQERAIRAWARNAGHRIVGWERDEGVSGATDAASRPGLSAALLALQHPPQADGIVVARLDRLARALTVQEATLAVAWQAGGHVFTADQGEVLRDDPSDPMRTALRQVVGVFAELDRRMVVKRLHDGRTAKAAAGRHATGSYAYGYQGAGKGRDRDAAPRKDEQAAVARILELRTAGESYRAIAATLDAEGLRPRRAASWSAMSVRAVVQRETTKASVARARAAAEEARKAHIGADAYVEELYELADQQDAAGETTKASVTRARAAAERTLAQEEAPSPWSWSWTPDPEDPNDAAVQVRGR